MLTYPKIDPVALQLGPLKVHWYGLMYLLGFSLAWWLGRLRARRPGAVMTPLQVDDLLFYGALGVVLGGRIGYMLFYDLPVFLHNPLNLFKVWDGGMSFHGGLLGVMAAAQGTMNNFTFGNARYQYYETVGGGSGAGPGFDGADVVQTHMTNSRLTDPEVLEWRFPVRLESFEIRRGSGGRGRWRGGDGAVRRVRFLEPMTAAILSGHRLGRPHGMAGGEPGQPGRNSVLRADGSRAELGPFDQVEMGAGDVFVIETPGGGGYGA